MFGEVCDIAGAAQKARKANVVNAEARFLSINSTPSVDPKV
jgi:hypothetical protein